MGTCDYVRVVAFGILLLIGTVGCVGTITIMQISPITLSCVQMIPQDRQWFKHNPASPEAIKALRKAAGVELPAEYFGLLAYSNGGEGPLALSPWNLCLDSAEEVTSDIENKYFEEFFSGFVVFGGNCGAKLIAFDIRGNKPWPIVSIDVTNIHLAENAEIIAKDFVLFLASVGVVNT